MNNKYLINGGIASQNNIFYWQTNNVSVSNDNVTPFYKLTDGAFMKQISRLSVRGNVKISCTFKNTSMPEVFVASVYAVLDNGNVIHNMADFSNSDINEWSVFEYDFDVGDDELISSLEITFRYSGNGYGCVANISAVTYYSNIAGTVSYQDFVDKSILYGLDKDLPILGATGGDDND